MSCTLPRLVIAAPTSGSGKSTVAAGLMAAFARRMTVQGYKVGPDYIDPMYHSAATRRPSRNLDTWMVSKAQVTTLFANGAAGADLAIIEGVMGLYDGFDALSEQGSTAEVAKLLGAPVILVIDVSLMARSAGAMALGYRQFDPNLNLAGVICNRVAGAAHAAWVKQAVEGVGIPVLGCLPNAPDLTIPERHLGLYTTAGRGEEVQRFLSQAADLVEAHIDLEGLFSMACRANPLPAEPLPARPAAAPRVKIAVARDEAFCFYYQDNLDALEAAGAEICFFSPLRDAALPEDTAGVYFGGGYPELYAGQLAENRSMMASIWQAHRANRPIYAECGGLMYLTQEADDLQGQVFPMVGIVPGRVRMNNRLTMGYRQVTVRQPTLLLPAGQALRGHEFHYSEWVNAPGPDFSPYAITSRAGEEARLEGYTCGSLLASYVHLHFLAHPDLARNFVNACRERMEKDCAA